MSAPRTLDEAREAFARILRSGPMHVDGAVEHGAPLLLELVDEARRMGYGEGWRAGRREVAGELRTVVERLDP